LLISSLIIVLCWEVSAIPMSKKKTVEEIYQKKSPREHVLLRPDTYVGSTTKDTQKIFVLDESTNLMVEEDVEYVPALYKIFDEILVNAADNKQRDASMKEIRIKIDVKNGFIEVKNDGKGIPIEVHKEHNMYIPELIFGNLLTSSNYDDADLKTVGGRNGFGAKLANIFSTKFVVETVDSERGKKYRQKWLKNMSKRCEADIESLTSKRMRDYTKITFYPDFQRFGMHSFENEGILKLFVKRVYDIAGTTPKDLSVHLNVVGCGGGDENPTAMSAYSEKYNGSKLSISTFIDYVKLFIGGDKKSKSDYFAYKTDDEKWEVVLALSEDNEYRQVSHVNSIWTMKGGTHVKYVENQFVKYFKDNFKDKQKKIKEMLKPKIVRDHLFIFVNSLIVNPAFSSQTKEVLTTKSTSFGSKCVLSEDINKRLMNKLKTLVKEELNFKLNQAAKKTDGKRKSKLNLPPEIDDALDAGTRRSADCTLIVTEGLSAKTLAVAGITELPGRNRLYGIFPLKGKLLNVRDAPRAQINKNAEINNLKQILGLKHGGKYNDKKAVQQLRYGKVMIMTDQDTDGSHIKGLMINLFHSEWPELVRQQLFGPQHNESFIEQFITPIVVATKAKKREMFYSIPQYERWKATHNDGKGWKIKYYKGLGTWQRNEGKEHFRHLQKHRIAFRYRRNQNQNSNSNNPFNNSSNTSTTSSSSASNSGVPAADDLAIVKAFAKDKADARKEWISGFTECDGAENDDSKYLDFTKIRNQQITYSEFIDKDLILFSISDVHRSVPSLCDGLKPGQRKILYCCFLKNNLRTELRVAQLSGYVSEKSAYHHGEASLHSSIIGMAQDFVGSNNINLLAPNGMFGSRLRGGKDAASPRYIHTQLSSITRKVFHPLDDMIVKYQEDDGYPVEPVYYIPIIPMVLVNGAIGIGTGWSTSIPNYNARDIIRNLRRKLSGEELEMIHPYYRGFKGEIRAGADRNTYKTHGVAAIINTYSNDAQQQYSTIQVTELPVQMWTETYKKFLIDLEDNEQIENMQYMSSDIDVSFTFDVPHKARPSKGGGGARGGRKKTTTTSLDEDEDSRAASNSNSGSPQRATAAAANKKCKKKIYFSGELEETFLKDMKLISSIACTNMVLFDSNQKIQKYGTVLDILSEFYETRLNAYASRKKALLKSMEHELLRISNQARFILMIIDEEFKIAKRRKLDIVADLKRHGFDTWQALKADTNTLKNRAKSTDAFEEEAAANAGNNPTNANAANNNGNNNNKMEVDSGDGGDGDEAAALKKLAIGYQYLLSMSLSSLTKERVDALLNQQQETQDKVNALQQKSVKDLWRADLDDLEESLEEYEQSYLQNIEEMRKNEEAKRTKAVKQNAKKNTKNSKTRTTTTTKGNAKAKAKPKTSVAAASKNKKTVKTETKTVAAKTVKSETSVKKKKALPSKTVNDSTTTTKNPWSIMQNSSSKKTAATKKKLVQSDHEDSEVSPSPSNGLSLMQRLKIKRDTPQKMTRKRKRAFDASESDENVSDEEVTSLASPPRKKRNVGSKKKKVQSVADVDSDDLYEEEDGEDSEEEYRPSKSKSRSSSRSRSPSKAKSNKSTKSVASDDDEDIDVDDDDDDDDDVDVENTNTGNVRASKKRVLTRKYEVDDDDEDEDNDEDDDDEDEYELEYTESDSE